MALSKGLIRALRLCMSSIGVLDHDLGLGHFSSCGQRILILRTQQEMGITKQENVLIELVFNVMFWFCCATMKLLVHKIMHPICLQAFIPIPKSCHDIKLLLVISGTWKRGFCIDIITDVKKGNRNSEFGCLV